MGVSITVADGAGGVSLTQTASSCAALLGFKFAMMGQKPEALAKGRPLSTGSCKWTPTLSSCTCNMTPGVATGLAVVRKLLVLSLNYELILVANSTVKVS